MLDIAIDLVRQAGELLRQGHHSGAAEVLHKSSAVDLVTEYDLASEQLIVAGLRQRFPDHAIYGEETGGELPASGPVWVVDPLDGTTNFAHGYPVFCVTLALLVDGQPELGVTFDPLRDELFWAQRGQGAWGNQGRLRVSASADLAASLLATGFAYDRASNLDNNLAEFNHFVPRTRGVRRGGSAALDIAWVAAGRLDGYWERGINVWDLAAGVLLVREAGGVATTYAGRPWQSNDRNVAAANSVLHTALLDGLRIARVGLPALDCV